jgi:hypothetical protein
MVRKITVLAKVKDGVMSRRCRLHLDREFDTLIAAMIGPDASKALSALQSGAMEKATFPIDNIEAKAELTAHDGADRATLALVRGVKAIVKAPKDEGEVPSIQLIFEFPYDDGAWSFCGRNCGGMANISMKAAQLTLARAAS